MLGNLLISVIAGIVDVRRPADPRRAVRRGARRCGSRSPTSSRSSAPPSAPSRPSASRSCTRRRAGIVDARSSTSSTSSSRTTSCRSTIMSPDGRPQPAGRARQRARRRRAVRLPRRAAGHPGRRRASRSIVRDLCDERPGGCKDEPTVGADEVPIPTPSRRTTPSMATEVDRGRGPHHRLADPGQDPRRDPRRRRRLPGRRGRRSARPTPTRAGPCSRSTADDDDALDAAARGAAGARRQPRSATATPSSSPPTATACSRPASTPPPTCHRRCGSAATGSTVENPEMDCGLVVRRRRPVRTVPMHRVRAGDHVVVGHDGVRVQPLERPRGAEPVRVHGLRGVVGEAQGAARGRRSPSASGRATSAGGKVLAVCGPAVIHTGAAPDVARLVRDGWIDVLFAGNGFATHDIESNVLGTSLGVSVDAGHRRPRAATATTCGSSTRCGAAGSIAAAVDGGYVDGGVMYECVRAACRSCSAARSATTGRCPTSAPTWSRPPTPCATYVAGVDGRADAGVDAARHRHRQHPARPASRRSASTSTRRSSPSWPTAAATRPSASSPTSACSSATSPSSSCLT